MRFNTGESSPTLIGAKLVGAGIRGAAPRNGKALVGGGIDSGPLAISGFGALGDDTTTTDTTAQPSWLNTLVTGVTQFGLAQQQISNLNQLNQINIQRVSQGLAPINPPVAGPSVGVTLAPDVQNLLIYGGLGFGALFLLNMLMKR